jgi:uncharacterized DUF497 family protein
MEFEWDPAKSVRNARERGLPFELAEAMFDGPVLEEQDRRRDYGEVRMKAIGEVNALHFVCIYTDRGSRRRIISLRLAKRSERNAYRAAHPR